jgi:hypothetical protein
LEIGERFRALPVGHGVELLAGQNLAFHIPLMLTFPKRACTSTLQHGDDAALRASGCSEKRLESPKIRPKSRSAEFALFIHSG